MSKSREILEKVKAELAKEKEKQVRMLDEEIKAVDALMGQLSSTDEKPKPKRRRRQKFSSDGMYYTAISSLLELHRDNNLRNAYPRDAFWKIVLHISEPKLESSSTPHRVIKRLKDKGVITADSNRASIYTIKVNAMLQEAERLGCFDKTTKSETTETPKTPEETRVTAGVGVTKGGLI